MDSKTWKVIGGVGTLAVGAFLGIRVFSNPYDKDGYDKAGYDDKGYNREGLDKDGYNRKGYNQEGLDKYGCREDGYTPDGYDRYGYDRQKYNRNGFDRVGSTREDYIDKYKKLSARLEKAFKNMNCHEYGYAFYDARHVLEELLELIIKHVLGSECLGESMLDNLKICEDKNILGEYSSLVSKLHDIRKICNNDAHQFEYSENISHDTIYFVVMQIKNFLENTREIIGIKSIPDLNKEKTP